MKSYHDIVGDGGSDVLEQVRAQEESVARSLAGVRNLVAIGSGKGGVGKSTVTMQLACALRQRGLAVSILDADLNGPCQARLGGLRESVLIPGERGASIPKTRDGIGVVSMGSLVPEPRAVEFETVAAGASHTWRATKEFTILRELLAGMDWGQLDYLLVDLPPGVERIVQYAELLGPEAMFVLVGIPSDVARGVADLVPGRSWDNRRHRHRNQGRHLPGPGRPGHRRGRLGGLPWVHRHALPLRT